ncbi:MAG: hypothetical protein ABJM58_04745 [Alteripontixanthobacter sp.]
MIALLSIRWLVFRTKQALQAGTQQPESALRKVLRPRNISNTSGFQRAHMIGRAFLSREMGWFASLLGSNGADDALNGVLLLEGDSGGLLLGVAKHFGNNVNAFNALAAFGINAFSLNAQPAGITPPTARPSARRASTPARTAQPGRWAN